MINGILTLLVIVILVGLVMAAPFIALVILGIAVLLGMLVTGVVVYAVLQDVNPKDPS